MCRRHRPLKQADDGTKFCLIDQLADNDGDDSFGPAESAAVIASIPNIYVPSHRRFRSGLKGEPSPERCHNRFICVPLRILPRQLVIVHSRQGEFRAQAPVRNSSAWIHAVARRLSQQPCLLESWLGELLRETVGGVAGSAGWVSAGGLVTGPCGKLSPASRAALRTTRCQFSRLSDEPAADVTSSACPIRRSAVLSMTTARRRRAGSETWRSLMACSRGPALPVDARLRGNGE